MAIGFGVR